MDGNLTREGITADFEAMKQAGIGGMILMEVDAGIPKGPVGFMSPQWQELFAHAVREAERLGLQMTLNAGPGWTGSGGPWVKPEQSMQHLVASRVQVSGPSQFAGVLPLPARRPAFFGDAGLPPELERTRNDFYRDVAVLAFPSPATAAADGQIQGVDEKALYVRAPYSSQPGVKPFFPTSAEYAPVPEGAAVKPSSIVDLTSRVTSEGRLEWDVPPGNWTILRFGSRSTGANTRPAPAPGIGLESDKFDKAALEAHFDRFVGTLLKAVGSRQKGLGWTSLHIDSWEMGAQNWTARFREEFQKRRGYDPLPYYPVYTGQVVENREVSERFLWDLRQTAQELVVENHAEHLKTLGAREGLGLSIEPYDMNPCSDMTLGGVADVPMCEFWLHGFNTSFSVIESASVAHTLGRPIVAAEAFTSDDSERWQAHPASMKALGDWAFASGVNRIAFHRYQHQPWLERKPGMTMGPYGVHWERTQTWWDMVPAYHEYLARCQFMLRQGLPVADVCFLVAEGAPHVFRPPPSAMRGNNPPNRLEYNFDGCAPEVLLGLMTVKNGRLVLPDGMSYSVLVLPDLPTMTPALLRKVRELVLAGATVIGPPPQKSPSLSGYPRCDEEVAEVASTLWGKSGGQSASVSRLGKGRVIWDPARGVAADKPVGNPLKDARWIWENTGNPAISAPVGTRVFRRTFTLDDSKEVDAAKLFVCADNSFSVRINGKRAGTGDNFNLTSESDVTDYLQPGENVIRVEVSNAGEAPNPAGLIAALQVFSGGQKTAEWLTDAQWEVQTQGITDTWSKVKELGAFGMAPWNRSTSIPERDQYGHFNLVCETLREMGVQPDFISDVSLRYLHRAVGQGDIYFVANPEAHTIEASCSFRSVGKQPELWDPVTGETRALPRFTLNEKSTVVPLRFAPHQSFFIVFQKKAEADGTGLRNFAPRKQLVEFSGPWQVRFDATAGGPSEAVTFNGLPDWAKQQDEKIRFYSGQATYLKTFDCAGLPREKGGRLFLDLGNVKNLARVRLNGRDLGVVWCPPWQVEVTEAVQDRGNQLEVTVANLWPNRLIRDSGLPEAERLTWTTWNPFNPNTPLLESGLLGPVSLRQEEH